MLAEFEAFLAMYEKSVMSRFIYTIMMIYWSIFRREEETEDES
jgi:hypothetical protein